MSAAVSGTDGGEDGAEDGGAGRQAGGVETVRIAASP
jgi:hypothetical protein